ncbi:MAG: hypothetical protein V3U57_06960 [Robiginitomaculum sp.]
MSQSTSNGTSVKEAANRLQIALKSLEVNLNPLVIRVQKLEREAGDAQILTKNFESDRMRLAAKLDSAKAREKEYIEREKEFSTLAEETTREMDTVIATVMQALEDGIRGGNNGKG